jgi:hypothetical protein
MMQPEQPNTPSEDAQPSDAPVEEPRSDEQTEGSSPGWWQRLFNRRPAQETTEASGDDKPAAGDASKLSLSQEELERRIQAETDRREAKRAQEARAARRRELRDKDPFAYAEEERKEEQLQSQGEGVQQFFLQIGGAHDRAAIDPLVEALPKAERDRILAMDGAGRGLEGRKLLVSESLKALEKHWKAEGEKQAEARLRRNSAFRKQVLSEARSGTVEPELLPAFNAPSAADKKVADILRDFYGVRHNSAG